MGRMGAAALLLALLSATAVTGCGGGGDSGSGSATGAISPSLRPGPEAIARHRHGRRAALKVPREAELISGRQGWARTGDGVYWTADGGQRWRRITPPSRSPLDVQGVSFADPTHGWALAEEGHEGDEHPVFFTTVDGGRHWLRAPTPIDGLLLPTTSVSFDPVGAHLVFALVKQQGDTAENFGFLLRSDDGGRTWQQAAKAPPHAGRIGFESDRDGWLAGGFPAPRLWRTEDGGGTWAEVRVATPPAVKRVESESFLPPRIGVDGHGLLPAVLVARPRRATTAVLYKTADRGHHWRIAATVPLPGAGGTLEAGSVLAFRGDRTVVVHPPTKPRLTILTATGRGPTTPAQGLSEWPEMTFSGGRFGFATSIFRPDRGLVFTADGGRSWRPVGQPRGTSAAGWRGCPGRRRLRTDGVTCVKASAVLRNFFGRGPMINPGPSPAGWRCHQRGTGHTSDGGDAYLVTCRSTDRHGLRFRFLWTSSL